MANEERLARLKSAIDAQDMTAWNQWREENQGITPDLQEADLRRVNLQGAGLFS
jgi:hypothetical protein